jgi:hypothetical protein
MLKSRGFVFLILLVGVLMINTALAEDVAYVYRKDYKIDDNILDVFSSLNLTVKFINENAIPASFAGYKFVFVGDENFRKVVPVNKYPSVVINTYEGASWGITDGEVVGPRVEFGHFGSEGWATVFGDCATLLEGAGG